MRWHLRYGSSVFMRSQNNCEQLRETENKACTCIDLYSRQAHHSVYTNSDQLACFTQAHPRNTLISSKWGFGILRHSLEDLLTSAISSTFCGTGIFTSVIFFHNLCNRNIHDLRSLPQSEKLECLPLRSLPQSE